MAALMSLAALSIDALLPALTEIAIDINNPNPQDNQLLVIMLFLGLGLGQLISGPLSDAFGRKPVVYIGFVVFALASLICTFSTSIEMMVAGRVIQGIGLSAPRTISVAMVRDRFSGDSMARIMSFVTFIFIAVPVVAPAFGKLMLDNFGWQSIFYSQLMFGIIVMFGLWKRQPETLLQENRKKLKASLFLEGIKEFLKHKNAIVFTIVGGLVSGAFMVYLSASQQIFQEQYDLKDEFPLIFAGLAVGIGAATFLNGILVVRLGMFKMATIFTIMITVVSLIYTVIYWEQPNPSSTVLIIFLGLLLFAIGFLFGNINALAMQPIGHIAGIGAAILGFTSSLMAVPIAIYIGSFIENTALPLFVGFFISGVCILALMIYIKVTTKKV